MINKVSRNEVRKARHARIREKVVGTAVAPRLNVFRSNQNIFAQNMKMLYIILYL